MNGDDVIALVPLLLLGAAHGVNPAMGWLFAVGLGLQEQSRRAVWRALGPMALGHALAIAAALVLAALAGRVLPLGGLKWLVAATLLGFGLAHLLRHRHPRWGGMRVDAKDLTIWSFLMASAHGAGLMVLPFVLDAAPADAMHHGVSHGTAEPGGTAAGHVGHFLLSGLPATQGAGVVATAVHTIGYLAVTGLIAVVVYEKLGLRMLRRVWINLDVIWGAALVATAVFTLVL